jgi:hypothetical protein
MLFFALKFFYNAGAVEKLHLLCQQVDCFVFSFKTESDFSDLTDMAYEVFKEMLSEFLFGTVGNLLGIENRRTENVGMFERIIGAIRKHTIHKKMGCP